MSLNKIMLIGNVGQDPEVRYIEPDVCSAQIRLATSTPAFTLQNGTQVPERTEWHTVYLWRRLAKVAESYVHKGDKLYIEGELRYRSYTDKKGITHKSAEIWATNMEMLTPRAQSTGAAPTAQGVGQTAATAAPTANPANPFPQPQQTPDQKLPF